MSITEPDLLSACEDLRDQLQSLNIKSRWQDAEILKRFGSRWLRITCSIHEERQPTVEKRGADQVDEAPMDEEDDEVLRKSSQTSKALVLYDVIHSPAYQVPVLYITFKSLHSILRGPPSPDRVYQMLVPPLYRAQIESIGPIGALSLTDHPVISTPSYFIHPCRTAEAMTAVTAGREIEPRKYLLQWIGVIGGSVGLAVPLELAEGMKPSDDGSLDA